MKTSERLTLRQRKQFEAALELVKAPNGWYLFDGGQINLLPEDEMLVIANYKTSQGWMKESGSYEVLRHACFVKVDAKKQARVLTDRELDSLPDSWMIVKWDY